MARSKESILRVVLAVALAVFFVYLYKDKLFFFAGGDGPSVLDEARQATQTQILYRVVKSRYAFLDRYTLFVDLLRDYEQQGFRFGIENPQPETVRFDGSRLFQDAAGPVLELYPGEKRYFFDSPYMLTTDGRDLGGQKIAPDQFRRMRAHMGNFIRLIPLNKDTVREDKIVIEDSFPLVGVFFVVPEGGFVPPAAYYPMILVSSEQMSSSEFIAASPIQRKELRNTYLNLSHGVMNLEPHPVNRVEVVQLNHMLDIRPDAQLITVHGYDRSGIRWDSATEDALRSAKLRLIPKDALRAEPN